VTTDDPGSFRSAAAFSIGFEVLLGALAVAVASRLPGGARNALGLGPGTLRPGELAWVVAGTLGASHALDAVIRLTGLGERGSLAELYALIAGLGDRELLLAAVAFALLPGICEELLCRGLIQRLACRRLGTAAGIVLAAAAFGALHVDPVHAFFAGLLGVYLGLVCHWSGGVRASIACHAVNNLVALATAARLPELVGGGATGAAGGAALALLSLWRVGRRRRGGGLQLGSRSVDG
jgi:membrane protease YdiL (CAAX protease family)